MGQPLHSFSIPLAAFSTDSIVLERNRVWNGVRPKIRLVGERHGMRPVTKQLDDQVLQEPLPSILTEAHSLTIAVDVHNIDHVLHSQDRHVHVGPAEGLENGSHCQQLDRWTCSCLIYRLKANEFIKNCNCGTSTVLEFLKCWHLSLHCDWDSHR